MEARLTILISALVGIALILGAGIFAQSDIFLRLRTQIPQEVGSTTSAGLACEPPADLAPGTYQLLARATDSAGNVTEQPIEVIVTAPEPSTPPLTPGQAPTISITASASTPQAKPGDPVGYILSATNNGTTAVSNLSIQFLGPINSTIENVSAAGGVISQGTSTSNSAVVWPNQSLAPGQVWRSAVTATLAANQPAGAADSALSVFGGGLPRQLQTVSILVSSTTPPAPGAAGGPQASDQFIPINAANRIIASFDIGGGGQNPQARKVGYGLPATGWAPFWLDQVQPVIDAGVSRIVLLMPFGQRSYDIDPVTGAVTSPPGQWGFQFDAYLDAQREVPKLTEDFVAASAAFIAQNSANGKLQEAIVYTGSPRLDADQTALASNPAAWWERAYDVVTPLLQAGFRSIGFDASAPATPDTLDYALHEVLRYPEKRDPVRDARLIEAIGYAPVRVYLEAMPYKDSQRTNWPAMLLNRDYQSQNPGNNKRFFEYEQLVGEIVRIVRHEEWQSTGLNSLANVLADGDTVAVTPSFLLNPQNGGGASLAEVIAKMQGPVLPTEIDFDPADANDPSVTYTVIEGPQHGTLTTNRFYPDRRTYLPNAGYVGPDAITYEVKNPAGATARATIHLTVSATTAAPAASAAPVAPPPAPRPTCADGLDNDGDKLTDSADSACHTDGNPNNPASYDSARSSEGVYPAPDCGDSIDNDGDGLPDGADPQCHTDGNASNAASFDWKIASEAPSKARQTPQCSDGKDNDGDGRIDTADSGCHTDGNPDNSNSYNAEDTAESWAIPTQCNDGLDNNSDGLTDGADAGCRSAHQVGIYNPLGAGEGVPVQEQTLSTAAAVENVAVAPLPATTTTTPIAAPVGTTYPAQSFTVTGSPYSGIVVNDNGLTVARLADGKSRLSQTVTVPPGGADLYFTAQPDTWPADSEDAKVALYRGNQAWKAFAISQSEQPTRYFAGHLENTTPEPKTEQVSLRFLNDEYKPKENMNRDLLVQEITIEPTTGSQANALNQATLSEPEAAPVKPGLLQRLIQTIRRIMSRFRT